MFQYALYRWLCQKGLNVYLDIHLYSSKKRLAHEQIKLNYFDINDYNSVNIIEFSKYNFFLWLYNVNALRRLNLNKFLFLKCIFLKILSRVLGYFHIKAKYIKNSYREDPKKNIDFIYNLKNESTIYILGVFPRVKHINDIKNILLSDFSFKKTLPKEIEDILLKIANSNSVAIHLRRGDYVGDKIRDICSMSYYRNSIQYLASKFNDLAFFIFSDDPVFAKNNFFFLANYIIIDNSKFSISDYYDLFLMTKTNHLVISNSSFSWWAAWLNQNPEKIVIAPERYHFDNSWVSSNELYPEDWITLAIN
jgi:hypothetical protein